MKYPKVGEKFYWKTQEGEIVESTCFKIEEENNPDLETMFFISVTKNGGGTFITESDIISSNSKEVKEFKKELAKKKIKEIIDYLNQDEVYGILFNKLMKHYNWEDSTKILNILTKE